MKNKTGNDLLSLHELSLIYKETKCEKVFNSIYNRLEYPLFEHIFKILRNVEKTKIVRSKTFEKLFLNIDSFNPMYKFTTWIYNIARNEAYFYYKMEKKNKLLFFGDLSPENENSTFEEQDYYINNSMNDDTYFENEYIEMQEFKYEEELISSKITVAMECIDCLPEQYSLILKEKYVNNLKQKEIADKYDINFNTVKTRIYNATQNVKVLYQDKMNKILLDAEYGKI